MAYPDLAARVDQVLQDSGVSQVALSLVVLLVSSAARVVYPLLTPLELVLLVLVLDSQVEELAHLGPFPADPSGVHGSLQEAEYITDTVASAVPTAMVLAMATALASLASPFLADMAMVLTEAAAISGVAMAMVTLATERHGVLKVLEAFGPLLEPVALHPLRLLLVLASAAAQPEALVQ